MGMAFPGLKEQNSERQDENGNISVPVKSYAVIHTVYILVCSVYVLNSRLMYSNGNLNFPLY